MNILKKTFSRLQEKLDRKSNKVVLKEEITVYWTENGKTYHTNKDCPSLKRCKNIISGTLEESKKESKCSNCNI